MIKFLDSLDNFESEVSKSKILVDFYADWCGPCKMLSPILEKQKEIDVLKVNVDDFPELATKFGIMSIPTMIFFKNGLEVRKEIGFHSEEELAKIIKEI